MCIEESHFDSNGPHMICHLKMNEKKIYVPSRMTCNPVPNLYSTEVAALLLWNSNVAAPALYLSPG